MNRKNKDIFHIVGCGGHARSIADVLLHNNPAQEIVFVDVNGKKNEKILDFPIIENFNTKFVQTIIGIGDNNNRKIMFEQIKHSQNICSVIAKTAHLGINSHIASGVFIANNVHIGPETNIGDNTIINTAAIIEHEVIIGKHCHIAPNTTICGRSKIGDLVFVCAGATIIDSITICSNVIIGAGAVVVDDILESGLYLGVPAKKIR